MGYPAENRRYSLAEYIEAEEVAEGKNEYYDGKIYAMSGGTPAHSGISVNCTSALKSSFRSLGCRVFESNLRIQVESLNNVLYPDASVICGPLDCNPKSPTLVRNPTLGLGVSIAMADIYEWVEF